MLLIIFVTSCAKKGGLIDRMEERGDFLFRKNIETLSHDATIVAPPYVCIHSNVTFETWLQHLLGGIARFVMARQNVFVPS